MSFRPGQENGYYRGRIEAVDDYLIYTEKPDWKTMAAILGLPIYSKDYEKKEVEVAPVFKNGGKK